MRKEAPGRETKVGRFKSWKLEIEALFLINASLRRSDLTVSHKAPCGKLKSNQKRLEALGIKVLVEEGERAFADGRYQTHEEVARRLGLVPPRRTRKS